MDRERIARDPSAVPATREGTMFGRVMVLLTLMTATSAVGSYASWGWTEPNIVLYIILVVATFACVFWAGSWAKKEGAIAIVPGTVFAFLFGLLLGPGLAEYAGILGPETVTKAFIGTIGLTALCGGAVYLFRVAYDRRFENFLMLGLFGLIIYGVVTIFTGLPSKQVDNTYCYLGIAIFLGFFVVDFARLRESSKYGERSWGVATLLALNIFLDMANVFLFILRLLGNGSSDD